MGSYRAGIVVMVEQPEPGVATTRLCPPLDPEQAARLAEAFLSDTVDLIRAARCAEPVLAHAPENAASWFATTFPGVPRFIQRGNDTGARLANVFADAWKLRYQPCGVIGSASPDLPARLLCEAIEALRPGPSSADVVLGPCEDGGYYLIALRLPIPELFRDIGLSAPNLLEEIHVRAQEIGLRLHMLSSRHNVNSLNDLEALHNRLRSASEALCPATRAVLRLFDSNP